MKKHTLQAAAAVILLLAARMAAAQGNPKFEFGKAEVVKVVEWKALAKGGLMVTSGNSSTTNGTVAASASRKEGNNKLALEGAYAYGKSRVADVPTVDPMTNLITALPTHTAETTNTWSAKGRYDRFFTANNAGYVSALSSADKIAGKTFAGGGQIGYSRQVLKNDLQLLVAELGYDFSYERYVQQPPKVLDPVAIHSARLFVGETLKLSPATGITGSVEALFNLNKEGAAISVDTNTPGVAAFKDTRINGKLGLTTTLLKSLSVGVGFTLKYDQNPAPSPIPKTAPAGVTSFDPAFHAFAKSVDTLTEVTLIYTFL